MTIFISTRLLPVLEYTIADINRKKNRNKLGFLPVKVLYTGRSQCQQLLTPKGLCGIPMTEIVLLNTQPTVGTYTVIASIKLDNGNARVISGFADVPIEKRTVTMTCDCCKTSRQVKHVYLLYDNVLKEYKSIASKCINTVVGNDNTERWLKYIDQLFAFINTDAEHDDGDDFSELTFTNGKYAIDTLQFLCFAQMDIDTYGYVNKVQAKTKGIISTADSAINHYFNTAINISTKESRFDPIFAALHWLETEPDFSEHTVKLKKLCHQEFLTLDECYTAASLVNTHKQHINSVELRPNSKYFGKVAQRYSCFLKLYKLYTSPDYWVTYYVYLLHDRLGNEFKWITEKPLEADISNLTLMSFRIKAHRRFKDIKQTQITHVKIHSK